MPRKTLILTRPEAQSKALWQALGKPEPVLIAPLIEIVPLAAEAPGAGEGVILTSANGARLAPGLGGRPAWCVGARTAAEARARGADIRLIAPDAKALVAALLAGSPELPLVHLAGRHRRGDIVERLGRAGLEARLAEIYDQRALPVSDELRALATGEEPALIPLYSPRSALILGEQAGPPGPLVEVLALSPAVADAWRSATGTEAMVCARPEGAEMQREIAAALRRDVP